MSNNDSTFDDKINSLYDALYAKHGASTASLGWSDSGQKIRFTEVAKYLPKDTHNLLDIGCGLGQLEEYLRNQMPLLYYTGWDINPQLLQHCKVNDRANFEKRNILYSPPCESSFDAVVLIGSLNTCFETNEQVVRDMIAAMFKSCSKVCIISLMSLYLDDEYKSKDIWLYDPIALFTFARTLTRYVDLLHGYMPHDFTLVLYKR